MTGVQTCALPIYTDSGNITISGGRVTVTGENDFGIFTYSGTITLGCTTASDFIYVSSYVVGSEGTLKIADGQTLFDQDGNFYSGNGVTIPDGKTLQPSVIALTARQAPDGNYWTTYYNRALSFTIDDDENACAYTAEYDNTDPNAPQLTLHKLGKVIPKGNAVILVGDDNEISMTACDKTATVPTNNLQGEDVRTSTADIKTARSITDGTFYVMGKVGENFGFFEYTGAYMPARKAYLLVSGSAAPGLKMVFDETSSLNEELRIKNEEFAPATGWYTLDGRKLNAKPTTKGLYIHNGLKVVIK